MGNPSILIAFFLAIGSTLPGQAISACSTPWDALPGSNKCYLASWEQDGVSNRGRHAAEVYCNERGGTLASAGHWPATQEDPVMKFIKQGAGGQDTWVGATLRENGNWMWISETVLSPYSPLWVHNEPSGDGVCVEARPAKNTAQLNDQRCAESRRFLCEK